MLRQRVGQRDDRDAVDHPLDGGQLLAGRRVDSVFGLALLLQRCGISGDLVQFLLLVDLAALVLLDHDVCHVPGRVGEQLGGLVEQYSGGGGDVPVAQQGVHRQAGEVVPS